jgi:hypothetical protein
MLARAMGSPPFSGETSPVVELVAQDDSASLRFGRVLDVVAHRTISIDPEGWCPRSAQNEHSLSGLQPQVLTFQNDP